MTVNIIVFAGISVGGTDRIREKLEKVNAAIIIPGIIIQGFIDPHIPKIEVPRISGTREKTPPKIRELQIFPSKMVLIVIGQAINLSSVFCLVSQGNTMGPIDVAVRKITIEVKPETMYSCSMSRPIEKAIKSTIGNNIPWITTGPLL
jgi:hypothetical protein